MYNCALNNLPPTTILTVNSLCSCERQTYCFPAFQTVTGHIHHRAVTDDRVWSNQLGRERTKFDLWSNGQCHMTVTDSISWTENGQNLNSRLMGSVTRPWLIRSVAKGSERIWRHRLTASCMWREPSTRYSHQTQDSWNPIAHKITRAVVGRGHTECFLTYEITFCIWRSLSPFSISGDTHFRRCPVIDRLK